MMESNPAVRQLLCGTIALSIAAIEPASAQTPVIIVDIKSVADQVARNIGEDADMLPLTVQAPVHVAAKVCGVPATVLGMQGSSQGAAGCVATATSSELEKIVKARFHTESHAQ